MPLLSKEKFKELQQNPDKIRNICIVAHVDHGKTTLADSLIASNGIISPRMAGKLRYMDSRKDEQERGITMKSSSIALYYSSDDVGEYLVNLIDSPGHVDFSSEVSTAVRLCDGAVLVIDVVEGVSPQTKAALKQTWDENIQTVLVLNKIDRLILEMKLAPLDAYIHLTQILEQVNAVTGELFTTEVLERRSGEQEQERQRRNRNSPSTGPEVQEQQQFSDWSAGLEEADDSRIYFSPELGNVVFASAIDGWGFCSEDFVTLYSEKFDLDKDELRKTIWGDYYFNAKSKKILKGAQEKAKKPIFVQFVLDNIWALYDTVCIRKDKEKLQKIIEAIGVKITSRDLRHTDPKVQLQAVCSQWLPLATSVLRMVCCSLPAANGLSEEKVEKLLYSSIREDYPSQAVALKQAFLDCSSASDAPLVVFISKMFPVEKKSLPQYKPVAPTPEELARRREEAKARLAAKLAAGGGGTPAAEGGEEESRSRGGEGRGTEEMEAETEEEDVFVAFARVFSGCLRKGSSVYVLGPKHDPVDALRMIERGEEIEEDVPLKDLKPGHHAVKTCVGDLYLMMGRELELVAEAPAGNVIGIGGLEDYVLKSATLSTELACPPFSEMALMAVPILRVAVEPARPADLSRLVRGLKLLNQADACVQVIVQETGEHVLVTAGEVHLERCLDDLRNRYAKIEVIASEPIIPFRETVVPPPTTDMVNEAIIAPHQNKETSNEDKKDSDRSEVITVTTPGRQSTVRLECASLPPRVVSLLEARQDLIRALDRYSSGKESDPASLNGQISQLTISEGSLSREGRLSEKTSKEVAIFKEDLRQAFAEAGGFWSDGAITDKIWSFGPRRCGPNILFNFTDDYARDAWSRPAGDDSNGSPLHSLDSSFVNGFQLASLAGPLCEEPMRGVAFIVREWSISSHCLSVSSGSYGPLSGQILSAVKEGCRKSFEAQPQRLMAAMYSCTIQANAEVLGRMYATLHRRQGRVLHGDMTQGSASFRVTALLPVVESLAFAQEIRVQTSGLASPQLVFSHWEVIEVDPFWKPTTDEEVAHFGSKPDSENRAARYMNDVRRRKGLPVAEKIVQFAEKQRTLGKNK